MLNQYFYSAMYNLCGKQREATALIKSLVKLQPWFLSLRWKTCLRQNCSLGFSACCEGPAFGQNTWYIIVVIEIFGSLFWSKTLMELLTFVVNFDEVQRAQLAKSLSPPPRWGPWDIFRPFKVCSVAKESEWDAESNGKLPHLFIRSKTATLLSEFAVEDLPWDRTATLVPAFAVKDVPLDRTLWWYTYGFSIRS